jgi:hypothetical protein
VGIKKHRDKTPSKTPGDAMRGSSTMLFLGFILSIMAVLSVQAAESIKVSEKPLFQNIILFDKRGMACVKIEGDEGAPYSLNARFCRHTGEEKWQASNVCFCAVNRTNEKGDTFLHQAVRQGDGKLVEELLHKSASEFLYNKRGVSASCIAMHKLYPHKHVQPMASWRESEQLRIANTAPPETIWRTWISFPELVSGDMLDTLLSKTTDELERLHGSADSQEGGKTALQILVSRPDATLAHVKKLIACGASYNSYIYKKSISNTGETPVEGLLDRQYLCSKEAAHYLFSEIVRQKIKDEIVRYPTIFFKKINGEIRKYCKKPVFDEEGKKVLDEQGQEVYYVKLVETWSDDSYFR